MAVLAVVAADVRTVEATSAQLTTVTLGETVTQGQAYRIASDSKAYLTDSNAAIEGAEFDGIFIQDGVLDNVCAAQTGGKMYLGVATKEGMLYTGSPTPGAIEECTSAVASGNTTTLMGYGDSDGNFVFNVLETGETVS